MNRGGERIISGGGSKTVFGEGLYGMFSPPLSFPPHDKSVLPNLPQSIANRAVFWGEFAGVVSGRVGLVDVPGPQKPERGHKNRNECTKTSVPGPPKPERRYKEPARGYICQNRPFTKPPLEFCTTTKILEAQGSCFFFFFCNIDQETGQMKIKQK